MELDAKHEELLERIHDAEGERITKSNAIQIQQSENQDFLDQLNLLIENELVEFDKQDDTYYLTTEGYEMVEEIKKLDDEIRELIDLKYEHSKKRIPLKEIVYVLVMGLIITSFIFNLNGIGPENSINIKEILNDEVMRDLKQELETKTDSVLELQHKEEIIKDK